MKTELPYTVLDNTSEEEWLEQRRNVITATDVSRLAQSPGAARTIRAEKSGNTTFQGNKYTEWGKTREPHIAQWATIFVDSRVTPNDKLLVSTENPQWAATPDMITSDGDLIVEIKATKNPWLPGDHPQRYEDQIQWQLMVTQADACVLLMEPYEDHDGTFLPVDEPQKFVVYPDHDRQSELRDIAGSFLAGVDATVEEALSELVQSDLEITRKINELRDEQSELRDEISGWVGDDPVSFDLGFATLTRTKGSVSARFDQKRFKKDHPELAGEYVVESPRAGSLRITEVKEDA